MTDVERDTDRLGRPPPRGRSVSRWAAEPGLLEADIIAKVDAALKGFDALPRPDQIAVLNAIRQRLHTLSPFRDEPVDCVLWVGLDAVVANDYNPNSVAPPEMRLLEHSIGEDGFTQPVVSWDSGETLEVVDGFHRFRVARSGPVAERLDGYLPVAVVNDWRHDRGDRIAATIRHNRARGKHRVEAMSDIVVELKRRNWSNEKIASELGMDADEVLRLMQISGLAELFSSHEFSRAWEPVGTISESDFEDLTDDVSDFNGSRTVNTSDPGRIFHIHDDWECAKAGFYASQKTGVTKAQGEEMYRAFLSDSKRFEKALRAVTKQWKHSCEHYLTNAAMNRIAWLGQASMCYATGIPAAYRAGFGLLTEDQQTAANELALKHLNRWLKTHKREPVDMDTATSHDRQSDIY